MLIQYKQLHCFNYLFITVLTGKTEDSGPLPKISQIANLKNSTNRYQQNRKMKQQLSDKQSTIIVLLYAAFGLNAASFRNLVLMKIPQTTYLLSRKQFFGVKKQPRTGHLLDFYIKKVVSFYSAAEANHNRGNNNTTLSDVQFEFIRDGVPTNVDMKNISFLIYFVVWIHFVYNSFDGVYRLFFKIPIVAEIAI